MKREIEVLVEKKDKEYIIKAPHIGILYYDKIMPGTYINNKSKIPIGKIKVIDTLYDLILPQEERIEGEIAKYNIHYKIKPVQYKEEIYKIIPFTEKKIKKEEKKEEEKIKHKKGKYTILSPSDGIFYRKPSPDSSPYVEIGSKIKKGQVLGLVEVMKCFNQIIYTGTHFPEEATVTEICVKDCTEVKFNQPLFILE